MLRRLRKVDWTKKCFCILLTLSTTLSVLQPLAAAEGKYVSVKVGDSAPDFSLHTLERQTFQLSSLKGEKVVLLHFWATWCSVCLEELPIIIRDYSRFREKGYEVLSIVLNPGDVDEIRRVRKEQKINFPILLDSEWRVANSYGLAGPVPILLVVDGKGIIRFIHFGEIRPGENEIPYVIEELLTELSKENLTDKLAENQENTTFR
jgi:peroxiredoxin